MRPGIVYGGSRGIVADLFKDAANGLVRVVGPGDNHWPVVYDRDLGELYLRGLLRAQLRLALSVAGVIAVPSTRESKARPFAASGR